MSVSLGTPMTDLTVGDVARARKAFSPRHWVHLLYDWMAPAELKERVEQLQADFLAGYLWLPASEYAVPCALAATDVKTFLNSILLAKGQAQRKVLAEAPTMQRYRIRNWMFPATHALMKGTAQVGYMSFTYARPPKEIPPPGMVDLFVEFELFGGTYTVEKEGARVSVPLSYTPYVNVLYGPPRNPVP